MVTGGVGRTRGWSDQSRGRLAIGGTTGILGATDVFFIGSFGFTGSKAKSVKRVKARPKDFVKIDTSLDITGDEDR